MKIHTCSETKDLFCIKENGKKGYIEIGEGSPAYFKSVNPEQLTGRLIDEFLIFLKEVLK